MISFACLLRGLSVVVAGLSLSACGVMGDGQVVRERREVAAFSAVDNQTALRTDVRPGAAFGVVVTIDANLQRLIEVTVVGGELQLVQREAPLDFTDGVIAVTMPALAAARNEGSGELTIAGFTGAAERSLGADGLGGLTYDGTSGALTVSVTGSGSMTLGGAATHLAATLDGSGSVDGKDLGVSGGGAIDVTGSGSAAVALSGDATLSTEGSGSIDATLNGGTATFSVSGSGSIAWTGNDAVGPVSETGSGNVHHH